MKPYFFLFLLFIALFSCEDDNKTAAQIAKIDVNFNIERFDIAFAKASQNDLPNLKNTFPFLFPKKYKDTFWIKQIKDTLQKELEAETFKKFKTLQPQKKEITQLFKHLKYYFPQFKVPRVISVATHVDYRKKVVVTDSIMLLPLANYLGKDHYFYEGIQDFIKTNLKEEQLVVDLAQQYANYYVFQTKRKTLLDELIYAGKQLYFKDMVIPFKNDAAKISYTQQQLQWAKTNEDEIWRYFVDKELLYSTDSKLPSRFINPAPFSKFYLAEIDNDSPPRLGQFIGWQIVKAYMKNNEVTFNEMLSKSTEDIFQQSKYKPQQ